MTHQEDVLRFPGQFENEIECRVSVQANPDGNVLLEDDFDAIVFSVQRWPEVRAFVDAQIQKIQEGR